MQSRETRFVLRIESGERQGDQVALPEGTLRVGRSPECGLVLKDASVSMKHAELRVSGGKVQVLDLHSTNGTRVGGHKVEQAIVGHGDVLLLGNVRITLHDVELAGAPAGTDAPPAPEAPAAPADTGLGKVSADMVTRSLAGSRRLPLLLGALVLVAGAVFVYLRFFRGGEQALAPAGVPAVPGNLLADGSFEEGTGGWSAAESAAVAFLRERSFARSGEAGLGVSLDADGWSLASSAELVLHPRRSLVCSAALRVDGSSRGRVGVELRSSSEALPAFIAWSPAREAAGGFEELELSFDVLGEYDRARLVVAGLGNGTVALDDVSALEKEPALGAPKFNEYELSVLGREGSTAVLVRSGRVLLAGIDLSAWTCDHLEGWPGARLAALALQRGFELSFPGAPADARLSFWAVRPDVPGSAVADAWVATTGTEGYASHGGDFARSGVESLLLGSGLELLRLSFERPVAVSASAGGGRLRCTVELGGLERCELQLAFQKERAEAAAIAARAEELERSGNLGAALAAWTELLDRFPFERKLVARAEEARARAVQAGLAEVGEVRRELAQARFFLLPELFREGEARAQALASAYRGSEVEAEARKAAEECRMALTELAAGGRSDASRLLRGVLEALDPGRAPRLLEHVKSALESVDPGPDGD